MLERRKQSTARLLRRQLASVELNPDLVDEALYERFLELKNPQVGVHTVARVHAEPGPSASEVGA